MRWALLGVIVAANACGDVLNASGMRRHGAVSDFTPGALLRAVGRAITDPRVAGGMVAMAVAFFALMALLSIAQLSFAVPATSASYIVETALARSVLKEHVDGRRWLGVTLVAFGVALLAF